MAIMVIIPEWYFHSAGAAAMGGTADTGGVAAMAGMVVTAMGGTAVEDFTVAGIAEIPTPNS